SHARAARLEVGRTVTHRACRPRRPVAMALIARRGHARRLAPPTRGPGPERDHACQAGTDYGIANGPRCLLGSPWQRANIGPGRTRMERHAVPPSAPTLCHIRFRGWSPAVFAMRPRGI